MALLRAVYDAVGDVWDGVFAALQRPLAGVHHSDGDAGAAEVIGGEAADATRSYRAHEDLGLALKCRASALVDFVRNAPEVLRRPSRRRKNKTRPTWHQASNVADLRWPSWVQLA